MHLPLFCIFALSQLCIRVHAAVLPNRLIVDDDGDSTDVPSLCGSQVTSLEDSEGSDDDYGMVDNLTNEDRKEYFFYQLRQKHDELRTAKSIQRQLKSDQKYLNEAKDDPKPKMSDAQIRQSLIRYAFDTDKLASNYVQVINRVFRDISAIDSADFNQQQINQIEDFISSNIQVTLYDFVYAFIHGTKVHNFQSTQTLQMYKEKYDRTVSSEIAAPLGLDILL